MNQQLLLNQTISKIKKLPENKLQEINDYIDFLLSKIDDTVLMKDIQKLTSDSKTFNFLNEEEDLYDEKDLLEKF
jgi:hypothetical protein